jgi:thioredoxin 1
MAVLIASGAWVLWKMLGSSMVARAGTLENSAAGVPSTGFVKGKPGLIVFGSTACAACVHVQNPAAQRLEAAMGGTIQVVHVDVDDQPSMAGRFGIMSLPTVFILDATATVRRVNHGLVSHDELKRQLSPYLAP